MFRLNGNVAKKDRSVVTLRDFKGLDTVHSPMNITYQHAIDMRNLINRNGANRKRHGWRQEMAFDEDAKPAGTWDGKFDFSADSDGSDIQAVILHIQYKNGALSAVATLKDSGEKVTCTIATATDEVFSEGVFAFADCGNYIVAVGCGTVLVSYAQTSLSGSRSLTLMTYKSMQQNGTIYPANAWILGAIEEIRSSTHENGVESNVVFADVIPIAYRTDLYPAPSAANNFGQDYANSTLCDNSAINGEMFSNAANEKLNVLTDRERCSARFSFTDEEIEDAQTKRNNNPPYVWHQYIKIFRINDMIAFDTEDYTSVVGTGLADYEARRNGYYQNIAIDIYLNGALYKTIGLQRYQVSMPDTVCFISDEEDIALYFIGKNLVVNGNSFMFLDIGGQQVYDVELQIEFTRRNADLSDDIRNKFQKAKMVTLFGPEGASTRLLFCDGSNTILYTEPLTGSTFRKQSPMPLSVNGEAATYDVAVPAAKMFVSLYVGAQNTIVLGTTPITAWIKGAETSLYVFKEYLRGEETLYVVDVELITDASNSLGVNVGEAVFFNKGYTLSESAVNAHCTCSLANDVLLVSKNGVYGVTLSANVASAERFVRSRAEQIKNRLSEYDLSSARCIVWDNKMFLAVGGNVFVADARFRASFDGDMADTFNYEWWLWDNIPVKYWTVIDEKLCFLTSDNRLCSFYDGFADYTFDDLLVAVLDEGGITISKDFADYNKIRLNAAYRACIAPEKIDQIVAGALVLDSDVLYTSINEGDTVFFDVTAGSLSVYPVSLSTPYTVTEIDIITGQVKFADADGTAVAFTAGMNALLTANPLRISKAASEQYDMKIDGAATENNALITDADGNAVQFITYNGTSSYSATVYKYAPVVAYWQTGSYDFGTSMHAKTIERFSVAFDRESPKKMKLFYRTANRGDMNLIKDLQKQKDFDFDELSFLLFTFNNRFESSYSRKLLIRNFNFIAFRILSDEAEDFSVESLSFVYKVNKLNRGEH